MPRSYRYTNGGKFTNRDRVGVMRDILEKLRASGLDGHVMTRTEIIMGACLGTAQTRDTVDVLRDCGLVREHILEKKFGYTGKRKLYSITEKGQKYLSLYQKLEETFPFVRDLNVVNNSRANIDAYFKTL